MHWLYLVLLRDNLWDFHERFSSILTPKYLTLSVGKSLLQVNFNFILPSNCFCLDLKITSSVFLTLSEILLALSQYNRFFKSILTSLLSFLIDLPKYNKLVSSAKWCTLQNFIAWLRSFMYNKNRRGPRTEPWVTPHFISASPES